MSQCGAGYETDSFALLQLRAQDLVPSVCRAARALLTAQNWEEVTGAILADTGAALRASRAYLLERVQGEAPDGTLKFTEVEAWQEPGARAQTAELGSRRLRVSGEAFAEWAQRYLQGEPVSGMVSNFSPVEQQFLLRPNTQSMAVFPVIASGRLWGALGFEDDRHRRLWKDPELQCLRGLADILGAAAERAASQGTAEGAGFGSSQAA